MRAIVPQTNRQSWRGAAIANMNDLDHERRVQAICAAGTKFCKHGNAGRCLRCENESLRGLAEMLAYQVAQYQEFAEALGDDHCDALDATQLCCDMCRSNGCVTLKASEARAALSAYRSAK